MINNRKGYFFNLSSTASIRTIAPTFCSSDADCLIPEYCLEVEPGVNICGVPGTIPPGSPGPCGDEPYTSGWWNDPYCITSTQACCNVGEKYGDSDWYEMVDIEVF
ncbi:hypothetical protein KKC04_04095 [Patescibacteria group bacterium]|nr:hypothetical protein [Patescibacteria group bacterium]